MFKVSSLYADTLCFRHACTYCLIKLPVVKSFIEIAVLTALAKEKKSKKLSYVRPLCLDTSMFKRR